jgi:DNA-binding response OmpR family regulator
MKNEEVLSKKNILVIDPDEDFCTNVRLFLEENYRVTARQELDYIDYSILMNGIDLLLIEAEYAGTDVLALVKNLKKNHKNLKIIIMYTYFSSDKVTEKSLAAYTDDMINKPFDVDVLKEKIDTLLLPRDFSLSKSE